MWSIRHWWSRAEKSGKQNTVVKPQQKHGPREECYYRGKSRVKERKTQYPAWEKHDILQEHKPYSEGRDSDQDGVILKGGRKVIPSSLRDEKKRGYTQHSYTGYFSLARNVTGATASCWTLPATSNQKETPKQHEEGEMFTGGKNWCRSVRTTGHKLSSHCWLLLQFYRDCLPVYQNDQLSHYQTEGTICEIWDTRTDDNWLWHTVSLTLFQEFQKKDGTIHHATSSSP